MRSPLTLMDQGTGLPRIGRRYAMRFVAENEVMTPSCSTTVGQLRASASLLESWSRKRILMASDDPVEQLTCLMAAIDVGFELAIVPSNWLTAEWLGSVSMDFHLVCTGLLPRQVQPLEARQPAKGSGLIIFTSGTTQAPRPVLHQFGCLDTFGRVGPQNPQTWLVGYRPGSYAWTQVVMFGLLTADQHLVFAASTTPSDVRRALSEDVTAVSSTPSFWRYLLACTPHVLLEDLAVRQITLGGERADQQLLDRLQNLFVGARVTHIYASTECGTVLVCSDGRAGFPLSCLEPRDDDRVPAVRIEHGTLHVRSPYGEGGRDDWVDTHDTVDLVDGRLHITGRRMRNAIDVGGQIVDLDAIEALAQASAGVLWARGRAVSSAIMGSLVGLDLVLDPACHLSSAEVEREVRSLCRRTLGQQCEPRIVRFVAEPILAPSLKSAAP
jgi:acyl-CoA synthetase (AMP-forming)/AMP-acid ligase II